MTEGKYPLSTFIKYCENRGYCLAIINMNFITDPRPTVYTIVRNAGCIKIYSRIQLKKFLLPLVYKEVSH